jgi:hypothetical protein
MKIESVKVNFAVADRISRKNILEMMSEIAIDPEVGLYGVEIEDDGKGTAASAEEAPRKKRKYTRRARAAEAEEAAGTTVRRVRRQDGTTVE